MSMDQQTLEQIGLNLETAHAQVAEGLISPTVSEDAKTIAAAIALAGSEIALAIAGTQNGNSRPAS